MGSAADAAGLLSFAEGAGRSIIDPGFTVEQLRRAVDDHGAVLLRNYAFDGDAIAMFSERLFARFFIHGGARERVSADDRVQLAEIGTDGLRVHCEMAYTPMRPDLCIFACAQAPSADGETLLCDGVEVARVLAAETARAFGEQPFVHVRRYSPATWQRSFKTTDLAILRDLLAGMQGLEYDIDQQGRLQTRYRSFAFTERPGHWRAFANSLSSLADQLDGQFPYVEWGDGRAIETSHRREVIRAIDTCTFAHRWQAGDVLILDNWRFLHGRRPFRDTGRRLFTTFGYCRSLVRTHSHSHSGGSS